MICWIIASLFGFLLAYFFRIKFKFNARPSPGPTGGIPFIGYSVSSLGAKPHETFDRWSKEYGGVFNITISGKPYFILNSYDVIREAYLIDENGHNFLGRPQGFSTFGSLFEFRPFAFKNGPEWTHQRKLMTSLLTIARRGSSGVTLLEQSIQKSGQTILKQIESVGNEPIDLHGNLIQSTMDVVN